MQSMSNMGEEEHNDCVGEGGGDVGVTIRKNKVDV